MAYRDTKQALRDLTELATAQGGYFTAKQAEKAGYDYPHLTYHIERGNFERVDHGLYRIPTIPRDEHDEFIRLSLWSRGRDDAPQAVVSHESALALHDLSNMLPGKVHLTVPRTFRKQPPRNCQLHKGELEPKDVGLFRVFRGLVDPLQGWSKELTYQPVAELTRRGGGWRGGGWRGFGDDRARNDARSTFGPR